VYLLSYLYAGVCCRYNLCSRWIRITVCLRGVWLTVVERVDGRTVSSDVVMWTIHNILSTASQLSTSQKALGTLPEDGNVMPKHVGATIPN
jgi:hypothetical protein